VVNPVTTPKKARELRAILRPNGDPTPSERLLFRKVEKAFNQKNYQLATQAREIEALKATVERLKPTKRRRVVPDPNTIFATIDDIHRAQVEAGRFDLESSDSSEDSESEEESEGAEDCIVAAR